MLIEAMSCMQISHVHIASAILEMLLQRSDICCPILLITGALEATTPPPPPLEPVGASEVSWQWMERLSSRPGSIDAGVKLHIERMLKNWPRRPR